jgi:quercetin dioxygenase-like cupin family protein
MPDDPSIISNTPADATGVVALVGANVRRLRERAGQSLRELATRAAVSTSTLSNLEVYEATMEPGTRYQAEPHLPGVSESVIVVRGRMRVGPGAATVELGPGDRATFAADQPHTYEALAPGTRAVLVLGYR